MKSASISKRTFIITVTVLACIVVAVGVFAIVSFVGKDDDTKNKVPKDYDMSGIAFKDKTVEYDGNEHTLEIIGTLPHGVIVNYTPNKLTDVGSVEVTASFTGAQMYNPIPSMTATLTITKATYDMSGVTFGSETLPYDGQEHVLEVAGDLPEGITVNYTANRLTEIGSVEVTASFIVDEKKYKPIPNMTATLTIVKGTYDMSGITFGSETLPYDGLEHQLVIDGQLPEGVSVSYSPNKLTEIGYLEVTATFTYDSEHYNTIPNKTATLTIVKATHDMSGIAFEDKTVPYDGKEHTLEISGKLPDGVTVNYTPNTLTEIGSVEVTASFVYDKIHYNEIPNKTATLTVDGDGKYHKVTFVIDETHSQSTIVEHGGSAKDIPEIPQKTGYDGEWDKPLTGITEDLTVNINYVPKQYTITYVPNGGYIKERTQSVTYGEPFVLHEATRVGHTPHYMVNSEEIDSGIWKIAENATVNLEWEANKYKMTYIFNDVTVMENYATYGTQYTVPEYVLETCEAMNWTCGNDSYTPKQNLDVTFTADKTLTASIVHFVNNYNVSVADGNATITKYNGSEIDVVIPDRVKVDGQNYNVMAIAGSAFNSNSTMKSLLIPSGITSIGYEAIKYCENLETVYWDATACTITGSRSIFNGCNKLTQAVIGDNVTDIPSYAFYGCSGLTSVTIGNSVTTIGDYAFYNSGLTSITIPDSVTSIGECAFYRCNGLTSVTIPDGVTTIGEGAFYGCSGLTTVNYNAINCTSVAGSYPIFSNCTALSTAVIGENVQTIPSYLFYECSGLTSVTIPDGVTSIEDWAFTGCNGLTSVIIGNGVTTIGEGAFARCNGLTTVNYNAINCTSVAGSYPIFSYCTALSTAVIGEKVQTIPSYLFYDCNGLTSVTIGNGVTSIGKHAFSGCSGLTSITIPNSVTTISNYAFEGCSGLASVYYKGTASEWDNISIGSSSSALTSATRYYYSVNPPSTSGNYWHYDTDGVTPVVW